MRVPRLTLLLLVVVAAGCASQVKPRIRRVAVMPVDTLGVPAGEGATLTAALRRATSKRPGVAAAKGVTTVLASITTEAARRKCYESDSCLAGVGRRARAQLVLAATLAGLGDMRLVRARLVQSAEGIVLHDLQKTVRGDALDATAVDVSRRLFPSTGRRARWYRSWWLWTGVAVVAAATASLSIWATSGGETSRPDPGVTHVGDL